jgi:hypothetical protein
MHWQGATRGNRYYPFLALTSFLAVALFLPVRTLWLPQTDTRPSAILVDEFNACFI